MSSRVREPQSDLSPHCRLRLSPVASWIVAALCCLFLALYLAAQGRAIALMLRGFAPDDALSDSGRAVVYVL